MNTCVYVLLARFSFSHCKITPLFRFLQEKPPALESNLLVTLKCLSSRRDAENADLTEIIYYGDWRKGTCAGGNQLPSHRRGGVE